MGTTPKNKAIDAEYLLNQLKNLDKDILETKYVQEKDVKDTYTATDENPISGKGVSVAVNTLQQDINGKSNIGHKHTKSEITDFPTSMPPTAHTHDDRYYTESEINTKLNTKLNTSLKGSANGLAELDANGKVPSSQLPSFVDDIIEGYLSGGKFYKESAHTTEITGETGKIYIDLTTNKTYRWSGSAFVVVSETLALGETSSTAYRGDKGKIAYDHSQSTHARTDATKVEKSSTNGNIKINGTETTVYTHPGGTNPHGTTKSDVGLGNVGNFKAVSTVANQGLSDTEKSNARANIGAGTSSFSGSYNDLTNKPTIGNGTVTIKQNGASKGTFTMNQSGNTTIELTDNNTTYGVATSSTPGLVKSGTDITVDSSGNVSVNDDSHNHVISNVDGLQSALDGKATSSHTHTKSEVGLGNVDNTADASKNVKSSKKLQTYKQGSTTETYGDSYPIYAQWRDPMHVRMKCDNYTVETDYATSAGSADSVAWNNVTGKPSTYTPSSHTHTKSQITDFPSSLPANGGNSATVNGHTVNSDVPNGAKFTDTTYNDATTSAHGLMTPAMVSKLNGIADGATRITVDSSMSSTSTNPVQNKVVRSYIDNKIEQYMYEGSSITYQLGYMNGCIAFVGDHHIPGTCAIIYIAIHPAFNNDFTWYPISGNFSSNYTISKNSNYTVTISEKNTSGSMWAVFIR